MKSLEKRLLSMVLIPLLAVLFLVPSVTTTAAPGCTTTTTTRVTKSADGSSMTVQTNTVKTCLGASPKAGPLDDTYKTYSFSYSIAKYNCVIWCFEQWVFWLSGTVTGDLTTNTIVYYDNPGNPNWNILAGVWSITLQVNTASPLSASLIHYYAMAAVYDLGIQFGTVWCNVYASPSSPSGSCATNV